MNYVFVRNVVLKGLILFIIFDILFSFVTPSQLGGISLYNHLFIGRQRFPFGEDSSLSYNMSLFNLDAMFDSHIIASGPKPYDEYRVIVIGDSSTWGTLLPPNQTLSGQIDSAGLFFCGKKVRVYNLGYPTISLTKDLMVLDFALHYQPDLIFWLVSLEAFPDENQLASPLVANNMRSVVNLIDRYNLPINPHDPALIQQGFWDRTLIGQRRALADLFRLQMYGVMWAATGIDQDYPDDFLPAQTDFNTNVSYHSMQPPVLDESKLDFELLDSGFEIAGSIPVVLINEPILVSAGENSDLRYNFLYPRWVYDQWREIMTEKAVQKGWNYFDFWNIIPAEEFTNSAIHLTRDGETILVKHVEPIISQQSCK